MRAVSRLSAFALMGLLLSLPSLGADDKNKKTDPPKDDAKKADIQKDGPAKKDADKKALPHKGKLKQPEDDPAAADKKKMRPSVLLATVGAVVETKKSLRLRVKVPYLKANNGKLQVATKDQEVEWTVTDDVKVRMHNPPPQFDDKGRPKRYTAKELRDLKGNDKLPGYPADFSDLKRGQIVQVTVLQKKTSRPPKRVKGADGEWTDDNPPKISLIIIMVEPKE